MLSRLKVSYLFILLIIIVGLATGCRGKEFVFSGHVIDLDGKPVTSATIAVAEHMVTTDSTGAFSFIASEVSGWLTVTHPDFIDRTRAARAGEPILIRLTPDDGQTITIHFGGDTMFGRRFYDRNEDGRQDDGLLQVDKESEGHIALLNHTLPLLANADVTFLNLETPLTHAPLETAYLEPLRHPGDQLSKPRPPMYHQTKSYVYSSHASAANALHLAGVDIIGLGNNHVYDTLETGLSTTLHALEKAGFNRGEGYFGAGQTEAEAWQPAIVEVRGQMVAFLGCTTITGEEHDIHYVATIEKGGAAKCDAESIQSAITQTQNRAETIIFMIHGGYEYDPIPSPRIQRLTEIAREAGATMVINHHTHVVGGFDWDGESLVAWNIGNFIFDQTLWPTFQSYLLAVQVRHGEVVRAYLEPLMVEGYVAKGLTGNLATYVARTAAGHSTVSTVLENGALELDLQQSASPQETTMTLTGNTDQGDIMPITEGWLTDFNGSGEIRLGRDLLWTGSFEDEDIDSDQLEGALWNLDSNIRYTGIEYGFHHTTGVRLHHQSWSERDNVFSPIHRLLVEAGTDLSIIGMARCHKNADVTLQLSWYSDTRGPSNAQTIVPDLLTTCEQWVAFRVDATVPEESMAVGLYLRLASPKRGLATVDFDDLRLIEWASPQASFSPLYDHLLIKGEGQATFQENILPNWTVK